MTMMMLLLTMMLMWMRMKKMMTMKATAMEMIEKKVIEQDNSNWPILNGRIELQANNL